MLQYSSQVVETDTLSLEFSRKFPTFTLLTIVLSQMCPSHSHGLIIYTLEMTRIDEQPLRVVNLSKRVITVEFVYYLRMTKKVFTCKSSEVPHFPIYSLNLLSLFCYR